LHTTAQVGAPVQDPPSFTSFVATDSTVATAQTAEQTEFKQYPLAANQRIRCPGHGCGFEGIDVADVAAHMMKYTCVPPLSATEEGLAPLRAETIDMQWHDGSVRSATAKFAPFNAYDCAHFPQHHNI
jgi:hypothetical protein